MDIKQNAKQYKNKSQLRHEKNIKVSFAPFKIKEEEDFCFVFIPL